MTQTKTNGTDNYVKVITLKCCYRCNKVHFMCMSCKIVSHFKIHKIRHLSRYLHLMQLEVWCGSRAAAQGHVSVRANTCAW